MFIRAYEYTLFQYLGGGAGLKYVILKFVLPFPDQNGEIQEEKTFNFYLRNGNIQPDQVEPLMYFFSVGF